MAKKKGFVVFFLNINEHTKLSVDDYTDLIRRQNAAVIQKFADDGYESLFMPCFHESCRVEKIDMVQSEED